MGNPSSGKSKSHPFVLLLSTVSKYTTTYLLLTKHCICLQSPVGPQFCSVTVGLGFGAGSCLSTSVDSKLGDSGTALVGGWLQTWLQVTTGIQECLKPLLLALEAIKSEIHQPLVNLPIQTPAYNV